MDIFYTFLLIVLGFNLGACIQPYFPSQIVFSPDNGRTTFAIDQVNQRAYKSSSDNPSQQELSYAMKHFPYAIPDSPQSKYYVQLLVNHRAEDCMFETYWTYGGNMFNSFPYQWFNGSWFEIGNYIQFRYSMYPSNESSSDEDYWHSSEQCQTDDGQSYPCEEIYFRKGTEMPLRSARVFRIGWNVDHVVTNYQIISMGPPDEKYFRSIPEKWSLICRDVMLGLLLYPQTTKIVLNQNVKVDVWLIAPPHRINGSDTMTVQWNSTKCEHCFTWEPSEMSFTIDTFQIKQTLTITRVKNGPEATLVPIFRGGGFDLVLAGLYPIFIQ